MKTKYLGVFTIVCLLCVPTFSEQSLDGPELKQLETNANNEPSNIGLWLQLGQAQFKSAQSKNVGLLDAAQASFEHILRLNANEPQALGWHGLLLSMKAGKHYESGDLAQAHNLLAQGLDEMDRSIKLSPRDPILRRLRGETNLKLPEFLGRTPLGVEDLEILIADASFEKIRSEEKAKIYLLLGRGYSRTAKPDLAQRMWQNAVSVAPESVSAKEAQTHLNRMGGSESSNGGARPDRLTEIPDDISPIMTVATIAFKPDAQLSGTTGLSKEFGEMIEAMKSAKGFMGLRLLQSGEKPPMFVAISWWKNRRSLVDWYYNPSHQKMVKSFHFGKGAASHPVREMISHIGIEFYAPLRGGLSLGEKFGPTQKPVE